MNRRFALLLAGLGLAAVSCGRKGPLVLPPGRVPLPVTGLRAAAGEGRVDLSWTNPVKDIAGRPLGEIRSIEIWVFDQGLPEGGGPLSSERIEKTARLAGRIPGGEIASPAAARPEVPGASTFAYPLPPGAAGPAKLAFAVRVVGRHGRVSEFAGPVEVETGRDRAGLDRGPAAGVS